jgi:hypothetical protein
MSGEDLASFDVGQVCLNGHLITDQYMTNAALRADFCPQCGKKTVTRCSSCDAPIRGRYRFFDLRGRPNKRAYPSPVAPFCHACGNAFPWTEAALKAGRDYVDELNELTAEDREKLKAALPDLTINSPQTVVAATTFQKVLAKAGPVASAAMKQIMVPVLVDGAKTILEAWLK